mmetsp:Transcript_45050/g.81026  ORF Transcript_45050/g.81026 Transcript_45050/m.81026 type:complete len:206 (-) Transcript_45050:327-944(-)
MTRLTPSLSTELVVPGVPWQLRSSIWGKALTSTMVGAVLHAILRTTVPAPLRMLELDLVSTLPGFLQLLPGLHAGQLSSLPRFDSPACCELTTRFRRMALMSVSTPHRRLTQWMERKQRKQGMLRSLLQKLHQLEIVLFAQDAFPSIFDFSRNAKPHSHQAGVSRKVVQGDSWVEPSCFSVCMKLPALHRCFFHGARHSASALRV